MMEQKKRREKRNSEKLRLFQSLLLTAGVMILFIWVTLAWFVSQSNIATLVNVRDPSPISILGPHGEAMTALDLSYTDADKKGDTVTIRRVVSIKSSAKEHMLEIVHTTNMKGLSFQIYRAEEQAAGADISGTGGTISESAYTYTYDKDQPLTGSYINLDTSRGGIGAEQYKFADRTYHEQNYGEYGENLTQIHAEPAYWLADGNLPASGKTDSDDTEEETLTYYVLEITWTETSKETDIFYLLAKNV